MSRLLTLSTMLLVLAIFGCGPSEESKSEQGSKETTAEKVSEAAKSAVEEVKEMATAVADKAVEMEEKAEGRNPGSNSPYRKIRGCPGRL